MKLITNITLYKLSAKKLFSERLNCNESFSWRSKDLNNVFLKLREAYFTYERSRMTYISSQQCYVHMRGSSSSGIEACCSYSQRHASRLRVIITTTDLYRRI